MTSTNAAPVDYVIADDDDSGAASLTYSLRSESAFQIDATTGLLHSSTLLDFETLSKHELLIQVHDATGLSSTTAATVWVIDKNEAPQILANASLSVREDAPSGTTIGAVPVFDPDGDEIAVQITGGNALGVFSVLNGSLVVAKAALDYESISRHVLEIRITEVATDERLSLVTSLVVSVLDVNEAPVATAQTREVRENSREGQAIGLALSAHDPDVGQRLTFSIISGNDDGYLTVDRDSGQLSVGKGPTDAFVGCFKRVQAAAIAMSSNVSLESAPWTTCAQHCTIYQFMALTGSATCHCSNAMPVVAADQVADAACDVICQDATAKSCGGGESLAVYQRSSVLDFERQRLYALVVQVQDNGAPVRSTQFAVSIAVLDVNEPPSIQVSALYVRENEPFTARTEAFATTTDPDAGDSTTLSMVACAPDSTCPFAFNSTTNTLSTLAPLDFELQSSYALTFRAADKGLLSSEATLVVYVVDVNESPVIEDATLELKENSPAGSPLGSPLKAHDPDAGGSVAFSVKAQDVDGCVSVDALSGQLFVANARCFDFEALAYDPLTRPALAPVIIDFAPFRVEIEGVAFVGALSNYSVIELRAVVVASSTNSSSVAESLQRHVMIRVTGTAQTLHPVTVVEQSQRNASATLASLRFQTPLMQTIAGIEISCSDGAWSTLFGAKALRKTFNVTVQVQDKSIDALVSERTFAIAVVDVNEPPQLVTGQELTVLENAVQGTAVMPSIDALLFDPEGAVLGVSLQAQTIAGTFYFDSTTRSLHVGRSSPNFEERSVHMLTLAVQDGDVAVSFNVSVSVLDMNDAPQPQCTTFQVSEAAPVKTVLSSPLAVVDEDTGDTSFTYRVVNASAWFSFDSSGSLVLESLVDFETQQRHYFVAEVADARGLTGSCVATLDVLDSNESPVGPTSYNVSVHQSASVGHQIANMDLVDPENKSLSFRVKDPSLATLFAVSTDQFLVVANATRLQQTLATSLTLAIIATDGLHEVEITCAVTIVQDVPPIECPSPPLAFQVMENALDASVGRVDVVKLAAVAVAFELVSADAVPFQVNATTGDVVVVQSRPLDFETQSTYVLTFAALYGEGRRLHCPLRIDVIDQNEPPVCNTQEVSVAENLVGINEWLAQVNAQDPERSTLTYAMDAASLPFAVNSGGSVFVQDMSALNFESQAAYDLRVRVSDGVNTVLCQVIVTVTDTNDCPVFELQTRFVAENSAPGTLVGSPLVASDEDNRLGVAGRIHFQTNSSVFAVGASTGQVTVLDASRLDFERQAQFEIVVTTTDDDARPCTTAMTLVVRLIDVNEPPSIVAGVAGSVTEFTATSAQNASSALATVLATDPDAGDALQFALVPSNVSSLFRIDSRSGAIFASDVTSFDFEATNAYDLTVTATDAGRLSDTQHVAIRVLDVNEAPVFKVLRATVAENSRAGTVVIGDSAGIALDPEDQAITYAIASGNAAHVPFAFIGGKLVVTADGALDFETRASYQVPVQACDTMNLCTTAHVRIDVLDVNEAPIIVPATRSVRENAPVGTFVGDPVLALDPDAGQQLTFELSGGNGTELFKIVSCTGQLYVAVGGALDFETTRAYSLIVSVSDNGSPKLTLTAQVLVSVLDENEPPVLTLDPAITVTTSPMRFSAVMGLTGRAFINAIEATSQTDQACSTPVESLRAINNGVLCSGSDGGFYALVAKWRVILWNATSFAVRALSQSNLTIEFAIDRVVAPSIRSTQPGSELLFIHESALPAPLRRGVHEITAFVFSPAQNVITLQVRVGSAGWQDVTLTSLQTLAPQALERSISESAASGALVGEPIRFVDQDLDSSLVGGALNATFTVVAQEAPGLFEIDSRSGQLTLSRTSRLDFETQRAYDVLIEVNDGGAPLQLSAQAWLRVLVTDENEPPVVSSPMYRSISEDAAVGSAVGDTVLAVDPEGVHSSFQFKIVSLQSPRVFDITNAGQLVLAPSAQLDYESTKAYNLTVRVTDGDGFSTDAVVLVNVLDVNEPPTFSFTYAAVPENVPRGTVIGVLTGSDPENDTIAFTYRSSFADDTDATAFRIVPTSSSTAQVEVRNAHIDYERQARFDILINASDARTNAASSIQLFTVAVVDVNEPPVFLGNDTIRLSVSETATAGALVGAPLISFFSDPDTGDTLRFGTLASVPPRAPFTLEASTGQVVVISDAALDFETQRQFVLTVEVTDSASNMLVVDIVIALEDVNEPPFFRDEVVQVYVGESATALPSIMRVSAVDPEGDTSRLQYHIVHSTAGDLFSLSLDGKLSTTRAVVGGASYNVTVQAIDQASAGVLSTTNQIVQVRVSRINTPPVVGNFIFDVDENAPTGILIGQVTGSDANPDSVLTFTVNPDVGQLTFRAINRTAASVFLSLLPLDFETESRIVFALCATDDGADNNYVAQMTGCGTLTINIVDKNESPRLSATSCGSRTVVESTPLPDGTHAFVWYKSCKM